MTKPRPAETDVAAAVVAYLRGIGWTVYQEVEGVGSGRADIVATWRDRLVWIVECKVALSWDLLDQAEQRIGHAHRVSVAIPARRLHGPTWGARRPVEERVVRALGLGLFVGAREVVSPAALVPSDHKSIMRTLRRLRPEQASGEYAGAGSAGGGYWTPFRGTVRAMIESVRTRPGMTTREIVAAIDHHYGADGQAARNMIRWLGTTALDGTGLCARRSDEPGQPWRWYVDPDAEQFGRCGGEDCAMPVRLSCARCRAKLCDRCIDGHRCRCTARRGCIRPGVRICRCGGSARVLCERCEECDECRRRREYEGDGHQLPTMGTTRPTSKP